MPKCGKDLSSSYNLTNIAVLGTQIVITSPTDPFSFDLDSGPAFPTDSISPITSSYNYVRGIKIVGIRVNGAAWWATDAYNRVVLVQLYSSQGYQQEMNFATDMAVDASGRYFVALGADEASSGGNNLYLVDTATEFANNTELYIPSSYSLDNQVRVAVAGVRYGKANQFPVF